MPFPDREVWRVLSTTNDEETFHGGGGGGASRLSKCAGWCFRVCKGWWGRGLRAELGGLAGNFPPLQSGSRPQSPCHLRSAVSIVQSGGVVTQSGNTQFRRPGPQGEGGGRSQADLYGKSVHDVGLCRNIGLDMNLPATAQRPSVPWHRSALHKIPVNLQHTDSHAAKWATLTRPCGAPKLLQDEAMSNSIRSGTSSPLSLGPAACQQAQLTPAVHRRMLNESAGQGVRGRALLRVTLHCVRALQEWQAVLRSHQSAPESAKMRQDTTFCKLKVHAFSDNTDILQLPLTANQSKPRSGRPVTSSLFRNTIE